MVTVTYGQRSQVLGYKSSVACPLNNGESSALRRYSQSPFVFPYSFSPFMFGLRFHHKANCPQRDMACPKHLQQPSDLPIPYQLSISWKYLGPSGLPWTHSPLSDPWLLLLWPKSLWLALPCMRSPKLEVQASLIIAITKTPDRCNLKEEKWVWACGLSSQVVPRLKHHGEKAQERKAACQKRREPERPEKARDKNIPF